MAEGGVSAASLGVLLGLLSTYSYLVSSVVAIPDKKGYVAEESSNRNHAHYPQQKNQYQQQNSPRNVVPVAEGRAPPFRPRSGLLRTYRLEDFFWTGSGDGDDGDRSDGRIPATWKMTTVFKTTTIITTVYPTPLYTTLWTQSERTCSVNCLSSDVISVEPSWPVDVLTPSLIHPSAPEVTPTIPVVSPTYHDGLPQPTATLAPDLSTIATLETPTSTTYSPPIAPPDKKYWIITVFKGNDSINEIPQNKLRTTMQDKLAKLYKTAFERQQDQHLGISNGSSTTPAPPPRFRRGFGRIQEQVEVHIHNVTAREEEREVELLYSVHVGGNPILAKTAVYDMRLVTEFEVTNELGYFIITKAEPYVKEPEFFSSGTKDKRWILITVVVSVSLLVFVIVIVLLLLWKKYRKRKGLGDANRRHVFEGGATNLAYEEEPEAKPSSARTDPARRSTSPDETPAVPSVTFQDDVVRRGGGAKRSSRGTKRKHKLGKKTSPTATPSTESENSDRALVKHKRDKRKDTEKIGEDDVVDSRKSEKRPVSGAAHGDKRKEMRTRPTSGQLGFTDDNADEVSDFENIDEDDTGMGGSTVVLQKPSSPNSFLSMPSVKNFPRGANIPETLSRLLEKNPAREQVSVKHLDVYPDDSAFDPRNRHTRHGSIEEDPGVLGPKVFEYYQRRLKEAKRSETRDAETEAKLAPRSEEKKIQTNHLSVDDTEEGSSQHESASHMRKVRRRFNELLDDAFTLFGSKSEEEEEGSSPPLRRTDQRVQSALDRPSDPLLEQGISQYRPSTSYSRKQLVGRSRPRVASAGPRGAWEVDNDPLRSQRRSRPLSAGPFRRSRTLTVPETPTSNTDDSTYRTSPSEPIVDSRFILVDSNLPATDPAVPLIEAIKDELKKFQCGTNLPGSTSKQ